MNLISRLDTIVFLFYFVVVAGYGLWVYRRKKSANTSASQRSSSTTYSARSAARISPTVRGC